MVAGTYRKSSSEINSVPMAPLSAAKQTCLGPYHALISSVESILKNLPLLLVYIANAEKGNYYLSNARPSRANFVSFNCETILETINQWFENR